MLLKWIFVWILAVFDLWYFWDNKKTALEWELNPIISSVFNSIGFMGVVFIKCGGLLFAMFISRYRPIVTNIAVAAYVLLLGFYLIGFSLEYFNFTQLVS